MEVNQLTSGKKHLIIAAIMVFLTLFIISYMILSSGGVKFVDGLRSAEIVLKNYGTDPERKIDIASDSAVCIINPDGAENDELFSWRIILKQAGIPFFVSSSADRLSGCPMAVLIRKDDKAILLPDADLSGIKKFVSGGGVIISDGAFYLKNGQLKDVFGWKDIDAQKTRKKLKFTPDYKNRYLDETVELQTVFSYSKEAGETIWTKAIVMGESKPVALFEDNSPAITKNVFGKGSAYLLGVSLHDVYTRNLTGRHYKAYSRYANDFEPMSDIFLFVIKSIYENSCPLGFTVNTAPAGYRSTMIMSHDVDFYNSMENSKKFAELEEKLGIRSTFFVQAKYITDYYDDAFFTTKAIELMKSLNDKGFEVGSHTVIHSKLLNNFEYGTGKEHYPEYRPKIISAKYIEGTATLCGEVRVPKMIFNAYDVPLDSYRPGHLKYHRQLPKCLEESGYLCSSSFSANDMLSYFPFRLITEEGENKKESYICEIPMAIEDELWNLSESVEPALALFKKIHNNGGVTCVLIHPDLTAFRGKDKDLEFEEKFVSALPKDCWKTTIRDAGAFWMKRDRLIFSSVKKENKIIMTINSPQSFVNASFRKNSEFTASCSDANVNFDGEYMNFKELAAGTTEITLDVK